MKYLGLQSAENRFFGIFSETYESIFVLFSQKDASYKDKQHLFFDFIKFENGLAAR